MKSMTGYAKRQCEFGNKKITIEIKTLNSKTLDLNMKYPSSYRAYEGEMRQILGKLQRGKIDLYMSEEQTKTDSVNINEALLRERYTTLLRLQRELGCPEAHIFEQLVSQSDIWGSDDNTDIAVEEWEKVAQAMSECVTEVDLFRTHEGEVMEQDIRLHVDNIEQRLELIPQYEGQRIETAKQRIKKYFDEFAIKEIDQNRFEQELIYYLEKLDITEEKVRLQKHIDYFRETMHEESCGKKLGFVAQEMGREINTTGSKANHVAIQKLVVEMKDELEKIKEQLGNIL